jgi:hypothetical protein
MGQELEKYGKKEMRSVRLILGFEKYSKKKMILKNLRKAGRTNPSQSRAKMETIFQWCQMHLAI